MIEVRYDGNLGNNLFQYCMGRILATELGYRLKAEPIPGFPATFETVEGADHSQAAPPILYTRQRIDLDGLLKNRPKQKIVLHGHFQRFEYYRDYKEVIRKDWLRQATTVDENIGKDDLVVGIRRGADYIPRHGLPRSYFEEAISRIEHQRMYICTNLPNDPFVRYFEKKYKATVRAPGALDNLAFIKLFKKVIISNSTFLWWGAFLSDAEQVIVPVPLNGFWSSEEEISQDIDLRVPERRYLYLNCRERYKSLYFRESVANFLHQFHRGNFRAALKKFVLGDHERPRS